MNTNGMYLDEVAKIQAKAKAELLAMPEQERQRFYAAAERRYRACGWDFFSKDGKDASALLEYVDSLPEPGVSETVTDVPK